MARSLHVEELMIVWTPTKDEEIVPTKYLSKRIQVQNNISEMFNENYAVIGICHFSEKHDFLPKTILQILTTRITCLDFEIRC